MGNTKKEIDSDKENDKRGYPTKLTPHNKQALVQQITLGNIDTTVQAIYNINNIIFSLVSTQIVRRALKENNL